MAGDSSVAELQHSCISPAEITERERFYGPSMTWIFDATAAYAAARLDIRPRRRDGRAYSTFRWKQPRKSVAACTARVLLDLGGDRLLEVRKMHPAAPCGGWGHLVSGAEVRAWLHGAGQERA